MVAKKHVRFNPIKQSFLDKLIQLTYKSIYFFYYW